MVGCSSVECISHIINAPLFTTPSRLLQLYTAQDETDGGRKPGPTPSFAPAEPKQSSVAKELEDLRSVMLPGKSFERTLSTGSASGGPLGPEDTQLLCISIPLSSVRDVHADRPGSIAFRLEPVWAQRASNPLRSLFLSGSRRGASFSAASAHHALVLACANATEAADLLGAIRQARGRLQSAAEWLANDLPLPRAECLPVLVASGLDGRILDPSPS